MANPSLDPSEYKITIKNDEVRQYVQEHLSEMAQDVLDETEVWQQLPGEVRTEVHAAFGGGLSKVLDNIIPGWDTEKIKKAVRRCIWELLCKLEDGKGVPEAHIQELFDEKGAGTQIVELMIMAAFSAIGAAAGGAVGGFLGTAAGKAIVDFVKRMVREELDQLVERKLGPYCMVIPPK
ncbi:MAG: hypothetical protein ACYTEQ_08770 [Planctomycetota bacterium]